uniref:hypothetical protein n=1 Tax=Phocaeicola vulgatus TaxID=821 RepID=UPI0040277640
MNLFNTSSEVAGFKLDYLEVWNWGTFDKKVYHMNLHGNNSMGHRTKRILRIERKEYQTY